MPQSSESPAAGRYPKGSFMGVKLKVAGWLALGAVAGALTTMQLEATARNSVAQLPIEELQQLAAVFGMVKSDYVEPVDEKKLIGDAIGGMVAGLDPHSQYFDKKSFKEFREQTTGRFVGIGIEMGMEDGLVKVVSADRRLARVPRRPEERRPDHQDRRPAWSRASRSTRRSSACAASRRHQRRAHRLPQDREPHLPGDDHPRGDPRCRACAPRSSSPGYALAARRASSRTARSTISRKARGALQAGAQHEGAGARPAQRPGRPARRRGRHLGGVPAGRRRWSSPPTARSPIRSRPSRPRPSSTCAAAAPTR